MRACRAVQVEWAECTNDTHCRRLAGRFRAGRPSGRPALLFCACPPARHSEPGAAGNEARTRLCQPCRTAAWFLASGGFSPEAEVLDATAKRELLERMTHGCRRGIMELSVGTGGLAASASAEDGILPAGLTEGSVFGGLPASVGPHFDEGRERAARATHVFLAHARDEFLVDFLARCGLPGCGRAPAFG